MRKISVKLITAGILVAAASTGVALAADQTILGKSFQVKAKGADLTKRKIKGQGKEKLSPNTLVGNPVTSGATLEVFVNGGSPSNQTFLMPALNWTGDAIKGFKYKDKIAAVKNARIKVKNGKFQIKVQVSGKQGIITVLPPNPGTTACFALTIGGGGDRYSVELGATSAKIKNKGADQFLIKNPTAEGVCPSGPPATTTTTSSTTSTTVGSASPSFVFIDASGLF